MNHSHSLKIHMIKMLRNGKSGKLRIELAYLPQRTAIELFLFAVRSCVTLIQTKL